jgi:hypothetical protein
LYYLAGDDAAWRAARRLAAHLSAVRRPLTIPSAVAKRPDRIALSALRLVLRQRQHFVVCLQHHYGAMAQP